MLKPVLAAGLLMAAAGAWYWMLVQLAPPGATERGERHHPPSASDVPHVRLDRLRIPAEVVSGMPGRDPFRRGRRVVDETVPRAPAPAMASSAVATAAATPAWPRLQLIGLAEGRAGGAVVRTAILSGPRGVHHVRAGEVVEQVYRLDRLAADGVELRLLPEDRLIRLTLQP